MTVTLNPSRFVPMKQVNIDDNFWGNYIKLVRDVVVPYQWEAINDRVEGAEKSHAVQNFKIAAGLAEGEFYGFVFQDTDVAKWLEAVAYLLEKQPNPQLESIADEMIDILEQAQQPDGYLNTYFTIKAPELKWRNLTEAHELYTAGHMIEAGVAYYQATGKKKLLDIVCRIADNIADVFGDGEGQIQGFDGHQEIELALVKLYHATNNEKYLQLSKYFIDKRGTNNFFREEAEKRDWSSIWSNNRIHIDEEYFQAHKPVREQAEAVGHAVRVVYMLSGMIDVARETKDESLIEASRTLWNNIVSKQMYITGGIGSMAHGEAFSFDYDLPNDTVYAETCASIGLIFSAKRMLELELNSHYADVMERALFNTVISGMALDGKHFFYVNPLEVFPDQCHGHNKNYNHIKPVRPEWYGCACCPPNLARLLASLGDYMYSVSDNTLYSHLFVGGTAQVEIAGQQLVIKQHSQLPWHGKVSYELQLGASADFGLAVRVPNWSSENVLYVNGEKLELTGLVRNGYAVIERTWSNGDRVELELDMSIKRMKSHPRVRSNSGKVALQRGPIVYCIEQADNGTDLQHVRLPETSELKLSFNSELAGGVYTIEATGLTADVSSWSDDLYAANASLGLKEKKLTFIPYYTWANRGEGEMMVWVKE